MLPPVSLMNSIQLTEPSQQRPLGFTSVFASVGHTVQMLAEAAYETTKDINKSIRQTTT